LKNVSNDDEEVGGEWIPLPKAIPAANPVTRDPVEKNRRVSGVQNMPHPVTPEVIEASSAKDGEEASPVDGVEGFAEIDFEHDGGRFPSVATSNQVRRVDNVLGDAPP
jgi:hypothetical protein